MSLLESIYEYVKSGESSSENLGLEIEHFVIDESGVQIGFEEITSLIEKVGKQTGAELMYIDGHPVGYANDRYSITLEPSCQFEMENRYLSGGSDKERFSVSTQHYNFAIKAFTEVVKKKRPDKYVFSIHETKTGEVLDDVRTLKSEVGIISFSGSNEDVIKKIIRDYGLQFNPLMKMETHVYVWRDHAFAGRNEVSLKELAEYPCISFDQSDDSNYYLTEEAMADHEFKRMIKSDDRATSMELIASLHGYSIGSGMLAEKDAILQGLVSIKLREEDPLTIGYIVRKESALSVYGRAYVEELVKLCDK